MKLERRRLLAAGIVSVAGGVFGAGCQAGYVVQQGLGYIRLIREECL